MKAASRQKKVFIFFRKNYIITIFIACILFVGVVSFSRLFLAKPTYIYVKVKVGQGLWWANTAKASIWHNDAINKGDIMRGITGNPQAIILGKRYYRWYTSDQYDVYINLKLKVTQNSKTGEYTFNRSSVSIGAPIELQFPKEYITGTVIGMSDSSFEEVYTDKIIYLTKRNALPWEYDAIQIGDNFFDGEDSVFKVTGKEAKETTNISADSYGNSSPEITEEKNYITIKAQVKLRKTGGQWVMGEDQLVVPGRPINISTPNFVYSDYIISKIE